MIIACCSTLPDRVTSGALERSVRSMLNQPYVDHVYIFYPRVAKRLKKPYPDPPVTLADLARVSIVRAEDHGPLTKVYPCTDLAHLTPDSGILLFDDDRVYPPNWSEKLVLEFRKRNRAVGVGYNGGIPIDTIKPLLSRWNRGKSAYRVGMLQTTFMTLYPRTAFPANGTECINRLYTLGSDVFTNDDILVGVWAHEKKIPLYVVAVIEEDFNNFTRVNEEDNVHVGAYVPTRVRAMLNTTDSLCTSPGQNMKIFRLALGFSFNGKLPFPWATFLLILGSIVLIILSITLPLRLKRGGRKNVPLRLNPLL